MIRLGFGIVICVFVTASFVDTYSHKYNDFNEIFEEQNEIVRELTPSEVEYLEYLSNSQNKKQTAGNNKEKHFNEMFEEQNGNVVRELKPSEVEHLEYLVNSENKKQTADFNEIFEDQNEIVRELTPSEVEYLEYLSNSQNKKQTAGNNKKKRRNLEDDLENWTGRWMPDRSDNPTLSPKVLPKTQQSYKYGSLAELPWPRHWIPDKPGDPTPSSNILLKNERLYEYESITEFPHKMYMGHVSPECDDAKTNLTIDWDHTPAEYTCYGHKIIPSNIMPRIYCENIPKTYKAAHKCMNQKIDYDDDIPIYGPHRPLWPVYGEYKYVPKQRWLHSLEHGAIVMLYHPCANPLEVERLRNLVNKCLWRHIITPYSYLDEEHPLALLSWGCRLTMSYVNPKLVNRFIRKKALRGPEWQIADDGQFDDGLLSRAKIVTDPTDSVLCPNM